MRIIHISGSPGSGKTTLGEQLSKLPNTVVIDTDSILQEEDHQQLAFFWGACLHKEGEEFREKCMTKRINDLIEEHRKADLIVFTGILNHLSPTGITLEFPFINAEKYFINIEAIQLLKQSYGRFVFLLETDPEFASDIASGRYVLDNSKDFLAQSQREKDWHLSKNYIIATSDQITRIATRELNPGPCSVCPKLCISACSHCTGRRYCSKECQLMDWPIHQKWCRK